MVLWYPIIFSLLSHMVFMPVPFLVIWAVGGLNMAASLELLSDTFYFFKYPSRSQDLYNIQQSLNCEKKAFKRFVSNRWFSAGSVCNRLIENWAGLKEFFLKKEHSKSIKESAALIRIASKLPRRWCHSCQIAFYQQHSWSVWTIPNKASDEVYTDSCSAWRIVSASAFTAAAICQAWLVSRQEWQAAEGC